MNSNLEKRFRFFIANLYHRIGPFGSKNWNSSAQKLEKVLKDKGIVLPVKLYYTYKLPDGVTRQNYMQKLGYWEFCVNFNRFDEYKREFVKSDKFTEEEKQQILAEMEQKNDYAKLYHDELVKILSLNPELHRFKSAETENDIMNILAGMVFGFAPDEIEYFCWGRFNKGVNIDSVLAEEQKRQATLESYGVRAGYILAPETAKMIISALEKNKRNVILKNEGRKI